MRRQTWLFLALALTILIWGNSFVLVQLAIEDGATPVMIALGRFLLASSVFGAYILLRRPPWPARADLKTYALLALLGVGVYYVFQYYGIEYAGASISAILVTLLCPVIIFLMSTFRLGERITREQMAGLVIAAVGSFFVITDGDIHFLSNSTQILGGLFGVACAFFWAVYTVEGKKLVRKYEPFASTGHIALLGTAMLVPIAVAESRLNPSEFPPTYYLCVVYLGVLATLVGYVLWFKALTGLSASATGATLYFEPVVTVIFSFIILGEGIGLVAALGSVLVLVGVVAITRGQR